MDSEKSAALKRIRKLREQREAREALRLTLGHKKDIVELTDGCGGSCADARQELKESQARLLEKRKFKGFNDDNETASGVDI